jgi:Putative metal-binding motif/Bacterial TSP3 repeat
MNLKKNSIFAIIALLTMVLGACQGSEFKAPRPDTGDEPEIGGLLFDAGDEEIVSGEPFQLTVTVLDESGEVFVDFTGAIRIRVNQNYSLPLKLLGLQGDDQVSITPAILRNFSNGQRRVTAIIDGSGQLSIAGEELDSGLGVVGSSPPVTVVDGAVGGDDDVDTDDSGSDVDSDGDGISDHDEENIYGTFTFTVDSDNDGLSDWEELFVWNTNALDFNDPDRTDTDGDGLSDWYENNIYGTDPADPDTDGDGLNDGDEVYIHGSDPTLVDTDNDRLTDFEEVGWGSDPNDPLSVPAGMLAIFQEDPECGSFCGGVPSSISPVATAEGIPNKVFSSNDMGTFILDGYSKVYVASAQLSPTFYQNLENSKAWFENWIMSGGYYIFAGGVNCSSEGNNSRWAGHDIPGGLQNGYLGGSFWGGQDMNVDIMDPGNLVFNDPYLISDATLDNTYWRFNYFTGADYPFDVLVQGNSFGEPMLINFQMGSGQVMATTINVYCDSLWWVGYYLLQNMLHFAGADAVDTDNDGLTDDEENTLGSDPDDPLSVPDGMLAIFQENPESGCSSSTLGVIAANEGIPYKVFKSDRMGEFILDGWAKVYIASSQLSPDFYQNLENNKAWFENWIVGGGYYIFAGAVNCTSEANNSRWAGRDIPGGLQNGYFGGSFSAGLDMDVDILDPDSLAFNDPNLITDANLDNTWWRWNYFTGADYPFTVLVQGTSYGEPMLIHFQIGSGCVIATTMNVAADDEQAGYPLIRNLLHFDDFDNDYLDSDDEILYSTDPLLWDTDGDLYGDATEVGWGTSPIDPNDPGSLDSDNDGYDSDAYGGDDCNDTNALVNPGGSDTTVDGIDQNCDTVDGPFTYDIITGVYGADDDGDLLVPQASGGTDVNDNSPAQSIDNNTFTMTSGGQDFTDTISGLLATPPTVDGATLYIITYGDYNSSSEYLSIWADGTLLIDLFRFTSPSQCNEVQESIAISQADVLSWGDSVDWLFDNSPGVGTFCGNDDIHYWLIIQ